MKNISFIHYYREFGGNMGTKRSEILQESQFFWFGALFFSQNWVNFKNAQNWPNTAIFQWFFEVYSILAEKQRTKPKKLNFLKNFASLGTHIAPKLAIIVEKLWVLCFVLRFCDESALWWFFLFFSKWSLMSSSISHVSLEDNTCHIWPKNTGIVMCCIHFRHKFEWNLIHFS